MVESASALTIGLTDESQFTGSMTTLDFESGVVNGPNMTFESGSGIISGSSIGPAHSGQYVLAESYPYTSGPDNLATFTNGVYQVGLWFGNDEAWANPFNATLRAYNSSDALIGSTSIAANRNDRHDQFLGLASDELIYKVVLDYGAASSQLWGSIDDFSYGGDPIGVPVPAPAWQAWLVCADGRAGNSFYIT